MTRQPRETYVTPLQHGFPKQPSAAVRRRRIIAIVAAALVSGAIAVGIASSFMASATGIPGVAGAADAVGAALAPPGDEVDGAIDMNEPISVFDTDHPAVSRLDPAVRDAIQAAAVDAQADGIELQLTSGWRSAEYQAKLLRDAIATYGSESAAREFVSTPEGSKHVTGEAVDIARVDPALWLEQYGSNYGLCRVFANESWHFELVTEPGGECPVMLANAGETE